MEIKSELADETFSETVDYLNVRELIKNIDYFYSDPLNKYIPITSAILIANICQEVASEGHRIIHSFNKEMDK